MVGYKEDSELGPVTPIFIGGGMCSQHMQTLRPQQKFSNSTEAEFLDEIQTEVLRVFLVAIHSHLY